MQKNNLCKKKMNEHMLAEIIQTLWKDTGKLTEKSTFQILSKSYSSICYNDTKNACNNIQNKCDKNKKNAK